MWQMTPYKLKTLFGIHKEFNNNRFAQEDAGMDDIDRALGGL